ncbi:Mu transposase C-terminal domain-containing protein [Allocoleopsis franciscana]|uniref:Mu transposase/integrase n=1 Tax=Allocoleopsis franciscana PCC 7113 TaxID=1173027 RepID=K9WKZ8_9CYAN|nr:Mu transposase C-terminal domain-containing protein [Allocoleopsis franciscana]AFZ20491.1 Mu transposase/integrase [Allocoleopsis franciscana PCC 7113]
MEQDKSNAHEIVTELSDEAKLKQEIIESLLEPCDRTTYGQRLKDAAKKLGKSVRTVQRLVKQWEQEGLAGLAPSDRADKGQHRISQEWQDFIIKTYREGNKGSKRMTRKQVALRVQARAAELGEDKYPNFRTVYRVLQPIIDAQEQKKSVRSPGWRGSMLSVKTRTGEDISVEYSNHLWQCDHTLVDVLLVDKDGDVIGRPWLTTVIDTYSRCIMGIRLGFDAPSSDVVALALRHAILPKQYSNEYKLHCAWGTYGKPEYFYTDGGKDFRSNHLRQIGVELGFTCMLRDRPSEGGVVERPFGTFNTELFSMLPGYVGSNVQKRPEDAQKDARLTLRDLEQLLVRYIVDNYNQRIDARMGEQTRFQRWEAGLLAVPNLMNDRELDICLMKQTNRSIYRDGYIRFENLMYQGECLAGYAGERVVLRYDPRDITTILVYRREHDREVFLAKAHAEGLETEQLSLEEAKDASKKIREKGKTISNRTILEEVRDRDIFVAQKKTKKERQKAEQADLYSVTKQSQPIELEAEDVEPVSATLEVERVEVLNYDELRDDYGW